MADHTKLTGQFRERRVCWIGPKVLELEYESPVYTCARWQTPNNIAEWPRRRFWRRVMVGDLERESKQIADTDDDVRFNDLREGV